MWYLKGNLPIEVYDFDNTPSKFNDSDNGDVWVDKPTSKGIIIYSVVTPIICLFSIIGNGLSIIVLTRTKRPLFKRSLFTYLTVLAICDFSSSVVVLVGGLCKGVFNAYWDEYGSYDALIDLPLGNFFNSLGVMAMISVTWDRVIFLSNFERIKRLRLCRRHVARGVMVFSSIFCLLMNIPYCFIFYWQDEGTLALTDFYFSNFYTIHSWLYLILYGLLPLVFLTIGNGFLINYLKKAKRLRKKLNAKRSHRKDNGIIVTLIAMIVCFLFSQIPAYLVSRTICASVLFNGDQEATNTKLIEFLRELCTILASLGALVNFLLFYFLCPTYYCAFRSMFCCPNRKCNELIEKKQRDVHFRVHVFVIDNQGNGINRFARDLTRSGLPAKYFTDYMMKI